MMWTDLRERRPGQMLAFVVEPDAQLLAETLVAFANSDGGTILIGVDEGGRATGRVYADEVEVALRSAARECRPPVEARWHQAAADEGLVFAIVVTRSPELHSLADGRVLVRTGAENHPLGGDQIRQLAATKSTGDFEAEPAPGAQREDLDDEVIAEFVSKWEERQHREWTRPVDELLLEAGALDESGRPTVAGVLLFAHNPQAFLPQSRLTFVKFVGTLPRGEAGQPGYSRREEIGGPLARIIQRTWEVLGEEMRIGAVVTGLEREEHTEYPVTAVREALVNAIAHRDYRLGGRRIEVRMFADRMEITSPGGLPGYITVDNIVEEHFSRNPRLVSGLYQWGYIEELGLGVDLMIEEMVRAGHPPPRFKDAPYAFTVTLYNVRERAPQPAWTRTMNERQARALTYVQEHGRITNREYRTLCPDVSAETLRLDLVDLVERGILLKIGAKKGTYYILK
ncbi:MAG: putative DNA binding domain-containing protein [Chloroflexi bacterium]|nr:putative DNA binding domain-containing protein [Chloroflexota bacterium]